MENKVKKAILFDFMRTLYDPETGALVPFARELLEHARKEHDCFLISKDEGGRNEMAQALGIDIYFKEMHFVPKKTIEIFENIVGNSYENVYVVGDRISSEIIPGNKLGYTTIWFKKGKFSTEEPKGGNEYPTHIVSSLEEVVGLL